MKDWIFTFGDRRLCLLFTVFKSMRTSSIRKRSVLRYPSFVSVSLFEVPLVYIQRHVAIIFVIVPAFALEV
jgi:hypothetical protein